MPLFEKVSSDIIAAMKARDKVRLEALRNIKKNLAKMAKQGKDTAALYREQNRPDLAAEEEAQVAVVEEYLPKQLSDEEIEAEVKAVIAETGASSMRDMGKVMGVATKRLAGRAEGQKISAIVKKLLA